MFDRNQVVAALGRAGVRIDGGSPWDIRVVDARFYRRVAQDRTLGLGESYVDGWWECDSLDELFARLSVGPKNRRGRTLGRLLHHARSSLTNLQSKRRATQVSDAHYDLSNELFEQMLDSQMQYSAGYWQGATTLEQAQAMKLELICQKLRLKSGESVLEIGGGWGGLARHMASSHGCTVTSLNVSKEQIRYARTKTQGLPVSILEMDYRLVRGTFDKIVSIEMFEAVGSKNFRTYMEAAARCLRPGGLFLLQTIGENFSRPYADRWITKYIFPNGQLPSPARLTASMEGLFNIEDWGSFGPDYDRTLMAWCTNFDGAWPRIRTLDPKFDERFRRMWRYYLLSCAGSFRTGNVQVWQVLLSKTGCAESARGRLHVS